MGLIFRNVNWKVVLLFGIPGILGSTLGAITLVRLNPNEVWFANEYVEVRYLAAVIGSLMIFFAFADLFPGFKSFSFKKRYLLPGGFISGFFGGLSGHQGALRSMFLIKANLSKVQYIATGVAIALLVDMIRIPIYWTRYDQSFISDNLRVIALSTIFAFLGAFIGKKMIHKITLSSVHLVVSLLMILIGLGLIAGKL